MWSQGPIQAKRSQNFEYKIVWFTALEAILCSFSTAVLEIAIQGILAAVIILGIHGFAHPN